MFSVVIPVYNHKPFVEEAVASAAGSELVTEILLVDDMSSDGSAELIERFPRRFGPRIRILRDTHRANKGAHQRLNQLCATAVSPWISILNSDDVCTPDRFALAREMAARGCSFITGAATLIDDRGAVIGAKRGNLDPDYPLPAELESADLNAELNLLRVLCSENILLTTSNMIFTKDLFQKLDGFRDLRYCHDWDFALRACLIGRPGFSHLPLTCYRIHPANTIQEPTPHVDGEVIRLFSRLFEAYPWITEDRVAVAALKGNRHLGVFLGDADIGRRSAPRRKHRAASVRPRCLVLIDHDGQDANDGAEAKESAEALREFCDVESVDAGLPEQSEPGPIAALEQRRETFAPDLVYLCGRFGWLLRNARAVRRIFGSMPIIDEHSPRDMKAWRAYYRSPAIHSFDRFIAESEAAAELLAGCGIPRNRIDIILPALKPSPLAPRTAGRDGLTYECLLIDDGHAYMVLDVARRCRDQGWPDRFLLSVAHDVPDIGLRYASAARLGNIALAGRGNADVTDAAIVLSPAAGFSAVLAAISGGRPVLAAATGEVSRLLKETGAGMTVAAAEPEQIWRSFVKFREEMAHLAGQALAGRETLRARYSKARRAEALTTAAQSAALQTGGSGNWVKQT